jgi:hypothetical protein
MDAAEDRMDNGRATLPDVLSARGKHRGLSSILNRPMAPWRTCRPCRRKPQKIVWPTIARIRGMAEKPAARTFVTEQSESNLTDFYFVHINPS